LRRDYVSGNRTDTWYPISLDDDIRTLPEALRIVCGMVVSRPAPLPPIEPGQTPVRSHRGIRQAYCQRVRSSGDAPPTGLPPGVSLGRSCGKTPALENAPGADDLGPRPSFVWLTPSLAVAASASKQPYRHSAPWTPWHINPRPYSAPIDGDRVPHKLLSGRCAPTSCN